MNILGIVLGAYLISAVFVAIQLQRAPSMENEPEKESSLGGVSGDEVCRKTGASRRGNVVGAGNRRRRRRGTRFLVKASKPVIRLSEHSR